MKKLSFTLFSLFVFVLSASADISSGMVGHWEFEGSANDTSGNGNNGTLMASPSFTSGLIGQAVQFGGVTDFVQISSSSIFNFGTDDFSLSFWMKTSGTAHYQTFFTGAGITIYVGPQNYLGNVIVWIGNTNLSGTRSVIDNNWHNIQVIRKSNVARLMIDGELETTKTAADSIDVANQPIKLGLVSDLNNPEYPVLGLEDELRLYHRALSDQESLDLYAQGTGLAVFLTTPMDGSTIGGSSVSLSAMASAPSGVVGVQFMVDGSNVGSEVTTSSFTVTWNLNSVSSSAHIIKAVARNGNGTVLNSSTFTVTVDETVPFIYHGLPAGTLPSDTIQAELFVATDKKSVCRASSSAGIAFENKFLMDSASGLGVNHTAPLSGLSPGSFTYYVSCEDIFGNMNPIEYRVNFVVASTPSIAGVIASSITQTQALISWDTDALATSQVEYGLTTNYGTTTSLDSTLIAHHSTLLSALVPSTTYYFRVRSKDASNREAISSSFSFVSAEPAILGDQIYIAELGAGDQSGSSCGNAKPLSWINKQTLGGAGMNWGAGAGQVGPGDTVHLCGTFTDIFKIMGSGTVGNPITIYFEPNAKFSRPAWGNQNTPYSDPSVSGYLTTVPLTGASFSNVIIDGGMNGLIECTDNGMGKTNSVSVHGINFDDISNVEIKNLTILKLYDRVMGVDPAQQSALGIGLGGPLTNVSIHDNRLESIGNALIISCWGVSSNVKIYSNKFLKNSWGMFVNDASYQESTEIHGLDIYNNYFDEFSQWYDTGNLGALHQDGIIVNIQAIGTYLVPGSMSYDSSGHYTLPTTPGRYYVYAPASSDQYLLNGVKKITDHTSFIPVDSFVTLVGTPNEVITSTVVVLSGGKNYDMRIHGNVFGPNLWVMSGTIYIAPTLPGSVVRSMVYNNIFLSFSGSGPSNGFIAGADLAANNTFVVQMPGGGQGGTAINPNRNGKIYNNLGINIGNGIDVYGFGPNLISSDYNVFANTQQMAFADENTGTSSIQTWPNWQNVYGYDLHSTTAMPLLDSNYIPTSQDTLANGKGVNLSGYFNTDITGRVRSPTTTWTIGAYETGSNAILLPNVRPPAPGGSSAGVVSFLPFKNIFNPLRDNVMTIRYQNSHSAAIDLKLFDRAGHEVRQLEAGLTSATWDGRNSSRSVVASGVYLVVLKADGQTVKTKVVVVK